MNAEWMVGTPMGEALQGSRLWRIAEGQRVVAELKRRLTARQIARVLGCSDTTVHDYGRGKQCPSRVRLAQLRAMLGD